MTGPRVQGPDTFSVPVTVQVPKEMYGRLRSVGRRHGVSVSVLLIEAARRGLVTDRTKKPKHVPSRRFWAEEDTETLRRMHAEGHSDVAISGAVGFNQGTVSKKRTELGLPPLFPGRPRKVQS